MSRTGGGRGAVPAGPGGRTGGARAAIPLAAAALGAALLALGAAVGQGRGAAGSGPGEGAEATRADDGRVETARTGVEALDPGGAYLDGPPPGRTGGFDEPTCRECHFDRELNPGGGDVRIEGVPGRYVADSVYRVSVVLTHDAMRRGGFQLAARWRTGGREGCSAGELGPGQEGVRAVTGAADGSPRDSTPSRSPGDGADGEAAAAGAGGGCEVVYLQHTEEGAVPVDDGVARWRVRWRAPSGAGGPVAFHVAANAANDDASEFGDRIYASRAVSRPPE